MHRLEHIFGMFLFACPDVPYMLIKEIVHFKPAPPVGDTPTPSTGLAAQLSSMDPNKLRQLLAIVNQKLHVS